jgi:hypothetical protein
MSHICIYLFPLSLIVKYKYFPVDRIHPGARGDTAPWTRSLTAQSVLTTVEEILGKAVPTIGFLFPNYAPIISVLIFGCTALALRFSIALDSNESDGRVAIT